MQDRKREERHAEREQRRIEEDQENAREEARHKRKVELAELQIKIEQVHYDSVQQQDEDRHDKEQRQPTPFVQLPKFEDKQIASVVKYLDIF